MKRVKLFEDFHNDLNALHEGWFSEIDIIGKEAATKEEFITKVKELLKKAANPEEATKPEALEYWASPYFDKDGKKKAE